MIFFSWTFHAVEEGRSLTWKPLSSLQIVQLLGTEVVGRK